jgi:hypothetical protein
MGKGYSLTVKCLSDAKHRGENETGQKILARKILKNCVN